MARDYAKLSPRFWTGHTGRQIRAAGCEAQVVALYLLSSPQANMIGLYYQPIPTLCHETGLASDTACNALRKLADLGFAFYDEAEEVVWVPEMARHQIADALKRQDKQVPAIEKEAGKYRKSRYYPAFIARYARPFSLDCIPAATSPDDPSKGLRSPSEEPPEALRSQEQDQEQKHEKEQEQDSCAEPEASASAAAPPVLTLPCVGKGPKDYGVTTEQLEDWKRAFPAVETIAELRRMLAWIEADPRGRGKTHRGMAKFIVAWLGRAQDGGGRRRPPEPGLGVAPAEKHVEGDVDVRELLRKAGGVT